MPAGGATRFRYADQIFALGRELQQAVKGRITQPALEEWFRRHGVQPRVVGTFEDSALIDAFGQAGAGLFAMPSAIEAEVQRQYGVRLVGRLESVQHRFYAITVDRKLRNPAVIAISERARRLFA